VAACGNTGLRDEGESPGSAHEEGVEIRKIPVEVAQKIVGNTGVYPSVRAQGSQVVQKSGSGCHGTGRVWKMRSESGEWAEQGGNKEGAAREEGGELRVPHRARGDNRERSIIQSGKGAP
jgi:hypothetical protein